MASRSHHLTADAVIDLLDLAPLEGEGGWFRQTWASHGSDGCPDPLGTAIFYLVTPGSWSALHRLAFDEVFHVYLGDPCEMVLAHETEGVHTVRLGADLRAGEVVQQVVPAGWWQGTQLAPGGSWALLGTTMAPGFTPAAFELATRASLDGFAAGDRARLEPYLP